MRTIARLVFAVAAISPLVLMQARPDLAPVWLEQDVGGVPAVVLLAAAWFAMFVFATWIPIDDGAEGRPDA